MWANIAMGCLGVAAAGTVVTLGFFYWGDIEKNNFLSSLFKNAESILQVQETIIATEQEPESLTTNDLNYTPYSNNSSTATNNDEITFGQKYGKLLVEDKSNDSDWWTNNFNAQKEHIKKVASSVFSGMKEKTPTSDELKSKCKEAYGKKINEIAKEDIENIWLLCSPMKHAPLSHNGDKKHLPR